MPVLTRAIAKQRCPLNIGNTGARLHVKGGYTVSPTRSSEEPLNFNFKVPNKLAENKDTRINHLLLLTNNTRFLMLPWMRVPHLTSHILSIIIRRIQGDWQNKYGHGLLLLETFVEVDRFRGTCYKAANWRYAGLTKGRSRNDRHNGMKVPVKAVYLYPLAKHLPVGDLR